MGRRAGRATHSVVAREDVTVLRMQSVKGECLFKWGNGLSARWKREGGDLGSRVVANGSVVRDGFVEVDRPLLWFQVQQVRIRVR